MSYSSHTWALIYLSKEVFGDGQTWVSNEWCTLEWMPFLSLISYGSSKYVIVDLWCSSLYSMRGLAMMVVVNGLHFIPEVGMTKEHDPNPS